MERFGHILRPRNNVFANKFARVDCLADCHWQSSLPNAVSFCHRIAPVQNQLKTPLCRSDFSWLGKRDLFQYSSEDLEDEELEHDLPKIRQMLDEEVEDDQSC